MERRTPRRWRRLHRNLTLLAALPLLITVVSGSIYGVLEPLGIEAFWLIRLHTGSFGPLDLHPYYTPIIGLLSLGALGSGLTLLMQRRSSEG